MFNRLERYGWQLLFLTGTIVCLSACDSDSTTSESPEFAAALDRPGYVAIRVDAASFTNKDERWYLTNQANIPDITPDPDPPHYSTAQGSGYLELLPDTRVSHNDELEPYVNYWADSARGPNISYTVDIPVPGRYVVWAKAHSTGTEDNGIHVGYDNHKPLTGKRIQYCSGKNSWTWSSAQRVPENHCGVSKTIYLDIPDAGVHDIVFYAREDGFELDQFILLKDPDDAKHNCYVYQDRIRCKDIETGKIAGTYDIEFSQTNGDNVITGVDPVPTASVDLDVMVSVDKQTATPDEILTYTVTATNNSEFITATSVVVSADLPDTFDFESSSVCQLNNQSLKCPISDLMPEDSVSFEFLVSPQAVDLQRVDIKVQADQPDSDASNDATSVEVDITPNLPLYDAALELLLASNTISPKAGTTHLLSVHNIGQEPISDALLSFDAGQFTITTGLEDCVSTTSTSCTLNTIASGHSVDVRLHVESTVAGIAENLNIELQVAADENALDNTVEFSMRASDPIISSLNNGEVIFEAEEFISQDNVSVPEPGAYNTAWFISTELLQPAVTPDFDSTPAQSASGGAYVELLPDTRTDIDDPQVTGVSNFSHTDRSPELVYQVLFEEPGTYVANARVRANNGQDASIHIGVDDEWRASAANIAVCNPDGSWVWTRSVSQNGQCNPTPQATINVTTPGLHLIKVAAATDGVELDKIVFSRHGDALPTGFGAEPNPFTAAEIDLSISSTFKDGIFSVAVYNPNPDYPVLDVDVIFDGLDNQTMSEPDGFDQCRAENGSTVCRIGVITPDSSRSANVSVSEADADISAKLQHALDPEPGNNATVATSGGGMLSPMTLLLLILTYLPLLYRNHHGCRRGSC